MRCEKCGKIGALTQVGGNENSAAIWKTVCQFLKNVHPIATVGASTYLREMKYRVPVVTQQVKSPTSNPEDASSVLGLAQQVKDTALQQAVA